MMAPAARQSIVPLAAVPRDDVQRYLADRGCPPEISSWKYYDERFNRGRARGVAYVPDGTVRGFIGLIPLRVRHGARLVDAAWSCDWSVDNPARAPGVGVLLLRAAAEAAGHLFGLNGNETTRALLPRIAKRTVPDAGVVFSMPLRAAHYARRAAARYPKLEGAVDVGRSLLGWLPTPAALSAGGAAADARVTVERGVSASVLAPLLESAAAAADDGDNGGTLRPAYDVEYVDWVCGRCPAVEAWTCHLMSDRGSAAAAAVVWRLRAVPREWRLALWSAAAPAPDAVAPARAVVRRCVRLAGAHGGELLSTVVAAAEPALDRLLRETGFRRSRNPIPFYDTPAAGTPALDGAVRGLSFLDTDMAYIA